MFAIIVLFILFALAGGVAAFECWKVYLKYTKLRKFVVVNGLPVVGNLIDLIKCDGSQIFNLPNVMLTKYNMSGKEKVCLTWMGPLLFLYTDDPDTYECILNSEKALKKAYVYNFLRNSKGIFTSHPDIWKVHRKALNPTLGLKMVNTFIPIFNEKAIKMVDLLEKRIGTNIDAHRVVFTTAMDSAFSTSFDVEWSMQNQKGEQIRDIVLNILERVQLRLHNVWMKWDLVYKFTKFNRLDDINYPIIHRLVGGALERKKIDMAEKLTHGIDELAIAKETNTFNYLQKCLQLQLEQTFSETDVFDELQTILVTSTDTTATVTSSVILMLAIHQEYQEQCVNELRSIFTDRDEPITKEHLSMMTFMELVIKETMRLYPVGPYLAREATDDLPLHGGIIPKGTQLVLNVYSTHRNTKYWGNNSREFFPERFLPEYSSNYHPYQFIPFSAGPRNCIGMRYGWNFVKILLSYLLRRYKFTTDLTLKDVKVRTGLVLKFKNKDPVRFERRNW